MRPHTAIEPRLFTVVIASRCDERRETLLARACDSVRAMANGHDYSILVVANGPAVSPAVMASLAAQPDVCVIRLRSGSYPLARRVGAEMSNCEFLAFLDDDDELLPSTLAPKITFFREHPDVAVLATDGFRVRGSTVTRIFPPPEERSVDLIETMMRAGWSAGAITLRARAVELWPFDAEFRHLEWTLTTLELASRYRFGYLDEPTYRYYEDSPGSLWKSAEHTLVAPQLWRRLSHSFAGTRYELIARRRYAEACNSASYSHICRGSIGKAWRLHLESMRSSRGLSALQFSPKLALLTLRRLVAGPEVIE
jgi:hypothetical protein